MAHCISTLLQQGKSFVLNTMRTRAVDVVHVFGKSMDLFQEALAKLST